MDNTEQQTDPVREALAAMDRVKALRASLQAERTRCIERTATIDALLADMGEIAKPKVGRPRGSRNKKEVPTQPAASTA